MTHKILSTCLHRPQIYRRRPIKRPHTNTIASQYGDTSFGLQSPFTRRSFIHTIKNGLIGSTLGLAVSSLHLSSYRTSFAKTSRLHNISGQITAIRSPVLYQINNTIECYLPHLMTPSIFLNTQETGELLGSLIKEMSKKLLGQSVNVVLHSLQEQTPNRATQFETTRWGANIGQIFWQDTNLSHWLCAHGYCLGWPDPGNPKMFDLSIFDFEMSARTRNAGLWSLPEVRILDVQNTDHTHDGFQIRSGKLRRFKQIGPRVHLEFSDNWKQDFTAAIAKELYPNYREFSSTHTVEIRGWVRQWHGPYMEITNPAAIRFLLEDQLVDRPDDQ